MTQGTSFGHYELRELLGRGGMGEVYRAFDPTMNRMVALKLLPPHLAGDPAFEQRFRREAVAAAALSDPHVIPIHSSGEIDGRLYVDMRLVEGPELHQLVHRGPLTAERAVKIVEQIAGALDAAHKVGLVHRDVKPGNIMLGTDDFAYLIDFGIAQAAGDTRLTQAGEALGTLDYMAPERFEGAPATPSSDIYALTCVLYQCLTGTTPFAAASMQQAIAGHMMRPPPRPSDAGAARSFDDVIARGMAKQPNQRYRTARQLASAARAALTAPKAPIAGSAPPRQPILDYDGYASRRQQVSPWSAHGARYQPVVSVPPRSVPPRPSVPPPPQRSAVSSPPAPDNAASASPRRMIRAGESQSASGLTWMSGLSRKRLLIAVAALVAIASFATTFALVGGGEDQEQVASTLSESVLSNVILRGYELNSIVGATDLVSKGRSEDFKTTGYPGTDESCLGAVSIAEDYVYGGSGRLSMRRESYEGDKPSRQISQSATLFESTERARAFYEASLDTWRGCINRDVAVYVQGKTWTWRAQAVGEVSGSVITQQAVLTSDGTDAAPTWGCPHAMGVAVNLVVEASICSADSSADVVLTARIVEAMLKDAKPDP